MNILLATTSFPFFPGGDGGQTRIFHIIKHLSQTHKVTLVSLVNEKTKSKEKITSKFCRVFTHDISSLKDKRVTKQNTKSVKLFRTLRNLIFYRSRTESTAETHVRLLRELIDKNLNLDDFDVFYLEQPARPLLKYFKDFQGRNIKIVCEICMSLAIHFWHKFRAQKMGLSKYIAFREFYRMRHLEKTIYNHSDLVITNSMKEESYLKKLTPKINIKHLPNGINLEYFQRKIVEKDNSVNILMTGNYRFSPNSDGALFFYEKIYPALKREVCGIHFIIAGKDPPERIQNLALRDPSVIVTGFVEDMRDYFNVADIFVNPLRIGGGARTKILEAFAMRVPVVSTTIGVGHGYDLEDGRHLHIADTPKVFIEKTLKLIHSKEERDRLKDDAYQLVSSEYSWDVLIRRFNDALTVLISNR